MRNLKYLLAAAALGSLMVFPQTSSAAPLGSAPGAGLASSVMADGLVQKVHGWHCYKRKGWYKGHRVWHRHYRACKKRYYDDDYYDDDYDDYDYSYYRPYHAYPYYYPGPFIGFSFGGRRHHGWDWDD